MISDRRVAVGFLQSTPREKTLYPQAPFAPPTAFPEFRQSPWADLNIEPDNGVYPAVRALLAELGLDRERYGSADWSPFSGLVKPGAHVVIKPNLVYHEHPHGRTGIESMITHASVARPLIDYLLLATDGDLKITICDVPLQSANWDELVTLSGFAALCDFYHHKGVALELSDLRYEISAKNRSGVTCGRRLASGDPQGYAVIDLGADSCLAPVANQCQRLEITDYGQGTVARHHNDEINEYFICKTVLDADLFINLPKMKCHRKAGVSLAMKNLVGINGDKSWIAHHRRGIDEYPAFDLSAYLKWYLAYYLKLYAPTTLASWVYSLYSKLCLRGKSIKEHGLEKGGILMEGNWHGNDTVWRSIIDLTRILLYSDKSGQMEETPQRKTLCIVDGIIGMEWEGPMDGLPHASRILVGGVNFAAVDYITSHLMGFSPHKIPQIANAFVRSRHPLATYPPEAIEVLHPQEQPWQGINLRYRPSQGWTHFLERVDCTDS